MKAGKCIYAMIVFFMLGILSGLALSHGSSLSMDNIFQNWSPLALLFLVIGLVGVVIIYINTGKDDS